MNGLVDWAAARARMIIAFITLSLVAGAAAYVGLPKEGEPDIEVPILFVSVPFPGISAEDAETLLAKPMEREMADLDDLVEMTATAAEGYAGVFLEFDFGWDKTQAMADVRDAMNAASAAFPSGAEQYSINEINFSEFPILIINLTGDVPERTLIAIAKDLQDQVEGLDAVLEAQIVGERDEMVEVVIDPLRLEAYNVTAGELIDVVTQNNLLVAAGEVRTDSSVFAVKIPGSFDSVRDIYALPVKTDGDRVITLGDLAEIRLTFEDRTSTARFNGTTTVALQVVKGRGYNIIDTAADVRAVVNAAVADWPEDQRQAVQVGFSNDQSKVVASMVSQLEGSVLTAIALVMIVVLAAMGIRPALLVGFAVPTSFLMTFALFAVMDVTISNIVMFGLILAVGMLVDGAVVVVEYADKRIRDGVGPMHAYTEAAKRMFWPIAASTATTLCAFLPMLFWPGVAGEFMGLLPVTLIFVLSASLIVALVYLPVVGGVTGRLSRRFHYVGEWLRARLPWWARAALVLPAAMFVFSGAMLSLNPGYFTGAARPTEGLADSLPGIALFLLGAAALTVTMDSARFERKRKRIRAGYRRSLFGRFIHLIAGNPLMPLVTIGAVIFLVIGVFRYYGDNNLGVDFFAESEPEQAIIYVMARGNLSLAEKDDLVAEVEEIVLNEPGVDTVFSFAGDGGLNQNTGGGSSPRDTIGQLQIELIAWDDRPAYARANDVALEDLDGDVVMENLQAAIDQVPGIRTEILNLSRGPASSKPVHLRLTGDDFETLRAAAEMVRARYEQTTGLRLIEDTLPLPGIDCGKSRPVRGIRAGPVRRQRGRRWAAIGSSCHRAGVLLDTMPVDTSDEEIEIPRPPAGTGPVCCPPLDTLRVRTAGGSGARCPNFISRETGSPMAQYSTGGSTSSAYYDRQGPTFLPGLV